MPDKSIDQLKAMRAAAQGHSTLGIPQAVGQEFSAATPSAKGLPQRVGPKKAGSLSHHHKAAGKAIASGDHKSAMHHVGHMLRSLKNASKATGPAPMAAPVAAPEPDQDDQMQPPQQRPKGYGLGNFMRGS